MRQFGDPTGFPASQEPSSGLIQKVKSRDPDAWRLLLELYGPVVHSWCRRFGLQHEDVADIVQEVFYSLMRNVGTFQNAPGGALRGWIWTITQNKLRDFHRRRTKLPISGGDTQEKLQSVQQPEPPVPGMARGDNEIFHRALVVLRGEFEERTWQAFWRSVVDEQESAKIGEELNMSANAVRQAKLRVLRRLREGLKPGN
jgi:RNA polymerase sigma-70 factor (ECF subfamily)